MSIGKPWPDAMFVSCDRVRARTHTHTLAHTHSRGSKCTSCGAERVSLSEIYAAISGGYFIKATSAAPARLTLRLELFVERPCAFFDTMAAAHEARVTQCTAHGFVMQCH